MTSKDLREKLEKAEEKVTKCENTIERHKKQLEKKQAKLLRVEWMAQYMDNLKAVMWDEEKRLAYKKATGDELYWDCCDVQSKEEDIKGAKRKLEDQKKVVDNWREKLDKQVQKELMIATLVPEAFKEAKEELVESWTQSDLNMKAVISKASEELDYKTFSKMYSYSAREFYLYKEEEDFRKINERDADMWLLDLYNRVVAVTGEITDASGIRWGGKCLDGIIIGKEGKAIVETIGAGGYNIQRWHLRTLVKEVK